jgi:hypothetical protein
MDSKLSLVDAAAQALHISVEVVPPDLTIKAEVHVFSKVDFCSKNLPQYHIHNNIILVSIKALVRLHDITFKA